MSPVACQFEGLQLPGVIGGFPFRTPTAERTPVAYNSKVACLARVHRRTPFGIIGSEHCKRYHHHPTVQGTGQKIQGIQGTGGKIQGIEPDLGSPSHSMLPKRGVISPCVTRLRR